MSRGRYKLNSKASFEIYKIVKENPEILQTHLTKYIKKGKTIISEQLQQYLDKGIIISIKEGKNRRLKVVKELKCPCCGKSVE